MGKEIFSPMEIDALGEMINISLGSSATAVSNMLDHRVDITTPSVSVVDVKDFALGNLEPAMGVEIKYVEGLEGSNLMLLRRSDIKIIVDILMGIESSDEEFELNELTISAVCEVMNQMMGAASTAMSDFLGFPVNISTPIPFELDDMDKFKQEHLPEGAETVVVIRFSFKIEDALESEFMNVMSVSLAKELLQGLGLDAGASAAAEQPAPAPAQPEPASDGSNKMMSQEEIERMMSGMGGSTPAQPEPAAGGSNKMMSQEEIEQMMSGMGGSAPAQPEPAAGGSNKMMSQEEIERMMSGMAGGAPAQQPAPAAAQMPPYQQQIPPQMPPMGMPGMGVPPGYMPMYYPYPAQPMQPAEPKLIEAKPAEMPHLDVEKIIGQEQAENLDLIMDVPLQVTVEIGRSRRKVQEILEFTKGSLVILDKLAGDQVDLFVNGKCIAKGDVVVIDDNFGVRITEIVKDQAVAAAISQK